MDTSDWLEVLAIVATLIIATTGGIWAVLRFRRSSPYSSERASRYEEAFREICIGTIPRMSSYDWKTSSQRFQTEELEIPPVYRDLIINAEDHDSRYASLATPTKDVAWIHEKILHGEEVLNKNRLYIDKADRDLFRDYMVLAKAFTDSVVQDSQMLDELFQLRDQLARVTEPKLRSVYK
jgi:hypothetical protein